MLTGSKGLGVCCEDAHDHEAVGYPAKVLWSTPNKPTQQSRSWRTPGNLSVLGVDCMSSEEMLKLL